MNDQALEIYRRYVLDLIQAEGSYFIGQCPFPDCGEEDVFLAGVRSSKTGELTNDFVCLGCEREGSPEGFIKALERDEAEAILGFIKMRA